MRLDLKTDLFFARHFGEVRRENNYLCVTNRENPYYHWGNFLLFDEAEPNYREWMSTFTREFGWNTHSSHRALSWSSGERPNDVQDFLNDGFELQQSAVLSCHLVTRPEKINDRVKVTPARSDEDWLAAVDNQCAVSVRQDGSDPREFKERLMKQYRKLSEEGYGDWFLARLNGVVVGDLGLFFDEKVGRYQAVGTHPNFENQGVCRTLIYESAVQTAPRWDRLVIVADPAERAKQIYENVGFKLAQTTFALYRPRSEPSHP